MTWLDVLAIKKTNCHRKGDYKDHSA